MRLLYWWTRIFHYSFYWGCLFPEHGRQIDHLNNHAEQALSEAKRLGGNTISYYCNKTTNPYKTADLEQELRKAIQNDEFVVYYQPKLI